MVHRWIVHNAACAEFPGGWFAMIQTLSTNPPAARLSNEIAIQTVGLIKRFGDLTAVAGIDLTIHKGEFFGLLGPNGAGKTTTVGMLTTRVIPTEGHASVAGFDVIADSVAVKRRIGVVTQSNTLDRSLTVRENLYYHGRFFAMSRAEASREADRMLELVRLRDRADAQVDKLSGGMQQRLQIGRALLHRPTVIFLDEPTAGIDPQGRLALWEILQELHDQGQTILLTTHYMDEADALCQRIAIMDHGTVVAEGSPEELKRSIGAENVLTMQVEPVTEPLLAALRAIPGVQSVEHSARGIEIYADGRRGLLMHLIEAANRLNAEVRDVSSRSATLENVFIKLTGRELRE
jgi:ABC-2 type transport system ATP-binding protein